VCNQVKHGPVESVYLVDIISKSRLIEPPLVAEEFLDVPRHAPEPVDEDAAKAGTQNVEAPWQLGGKPEAGPFLRD
ncbi:MAG TPA: hypothetical protein PLX97_04250, partial [Gemmatales bacterium]|nr:hypothetical protein [Gemmatales bacterium]